MSCKRTSLPEFSGDFKLSGGFERKGRMGLPCALLLSAAVCLLASCGPYRPSTGAPPPSAASRAAPSSADTAALQGNPGATIDMGVPVTTTTASGLAMPPDADKRPPLPGQSGDPLMPNGLPALQPHGVDLQKLFSQNITDPIERIKRVENAVVELRRDFDAVLPSIVRLVAVEQDMQDLTRQLGVLLQNEPQASSAAHPSGAGVESTPRLQPDVSIAALPPAPEAAPLRPIATPPATAPPVKIAAAPPEQKPPVSTPVVAPVSAGKTVSGGLHIRDLRIGEHPDKTRIVLDASGHVTYHDDLDNENNLLVIELPGAAWTGAPQQRFTASPLIASYSTQAMDNGGTRVIIQLKKSTAVVYRSVLTAGGNAPSRIVIDLKK